MSRDSSFVTGESGIIRAHTIAERLSRPASHEALSGNIRNEGKMAIRKPKGTDRGKRHPQRKTLHSRMRAPKRWVAKVKTDSTHPPAGLFTRKASTIARALASKSVSPKGPTSGLRMLVYFINRAGEGLSASRRAELEKAKNSAFRLD